ncbi:MAG: type II toxin-antitoxin system VapC family toxin [Aeromicrobium sp.]|uniref:type II toxin-antitoxin system VapC family toxin n=1 Tax=Aeromicrobium sp. TaxID=1871063 RepID=UPI0039E39871
MIALDTNVISELMRVEPDQRVIAWARGLDDRDLAVPAPVLAEIFRGLHRLAAGARRQRLECALDAFLDRIDDRHLLAFDPPAAVAFGIVMAEAEQRGRSMPTMDALIAATCRSHAVPLATRNIDDFEGAGIGLVDPWRR